ncbi:MAG: hypothetical protein AAFN93_11000 [Bacteroidota bacterium]
MEKEPNYLQDISEIRNIMERSSKFLSLSGLSGVLIGTYALIGAYAAYKVSYFSDQLIYPDIVRHRLSDNVISLLLIGLTVLVLAVSTSFILAHRKAKKQGEKIWDHKAKRLAVNLLLPLATGGIFIVILFTKGLIGLIAPTTLIFYGLALVNGSKYTYEEYRYLGIGEIVLGLIASYLIGYGLLFWALGFGVLHILYGAVMYFKYEK